MAVRALPAQFTLEVETKLVPFTVSVSAEAPSAADVGLMLLVVGDGLLTEKTCAPLVPPLGVGFVTVML